MNSNFANSMSVLSECREIGIPPALGAGDLQVRVLSLRLLVVTDTTSGWSFGKPSATCSKYLSKGHWCKTLGSREEDRSGESIWPVRLAARISRFQRADRGSSPLRATLPYRLVLGRRHSRRKQGFDSPCGKFFK